MKWEKLYVKKEKTEDGGFIWGQDEKDKVFEALRMHGKDYD